MNNNARSALANPGRLKKRRDGGYDYSADGKSVYQINKLNGYGSCKRWSASRYIDDSFEPAGCNYTRAAIVATINQQSQQ